MKTSKKNKLKNVVRLIFVLLALIVISSNNTSAQTDYEKLEDSMPSGYKLLQYLLTCQTTVYDMFREIENTYGDPSERQKLLINDGKIYLVRANKFFNSLNNSENKELSDSSRITIKNILLVYNKIFFAENPIANLRNPKFVSTYTVALAHADKFYIYVIPELAATFKKEKKNK